MQLILVFAGVIVVILGILLHFGIIQHSGYQLVKLPGYVIVIVGVIVALSGFFLA